ncbi:MAG TPA: hypothetical protein DHV12_01680 [Thermotogae bacterium]|nr:hypothetical protein [Thermotogota bacterium]
MRRFILIFTLVLLLLLSVSGFSMSNASHAYTSREILKMMFGEAPSTRDLMNLHRFLDVAPGRSYVGGAYHRYFLEHDALIMVLTRDNIMTYHRYFWRLDAEGIRLAVSNITKDQSRVVASIPDLQDSKTPTGVPKSGFILDRKTMLRYYLKTSIKPLLKLGLLYGVFDFTWRLMEGQSIKEAFIGTAATTSIYLGSSVGISYLAFRFVPASIVRSPSVFAMFSRVLGPTTLFVADFVYRYWESGSFKEALLSPKTAVMGALAAAMLVNPLVATVVTVGGIVYGAAYALNNYFFNRVVYNKKYEAFESTMLDSLQRKAQRAVELGM